MHGQTRHPVNTLSEARDFPDAVRRLIAGIEYELALLGEDRDGFWRDRKDEAARALGIYIGRMVDAKRLAILDLRDNGLEDIADALETGEWSRMGF